MNTQEFKEITYNALWKQNAGIVQLLGLCPLLAVSNTVVNAVSLGIATMLVMTLASASVAPIRNLIPNEARIPIFILIIAVLVTVVQYLMNAWFYSLYLVLGIFIPLIVTNCIVLARVETFASKEPPAAAALDGFMMGLGLTALLAVLGGVRELLGQGTLFSGLHMVFGEQARDWTWHFSADYPGFLLAILPPGAFIVLGFIIALKNWLDLKAAQRTPVQPTSAREEMAADAT